MEQKKQVCLVLTITLCFLYWSCIVIMNSPVPGTHMLIFGYMSGRIESSERKEICTLFSIRNHIHQHTTFMESGEVVGLNTNSTSSDLQVFYDPGICKLQSKPYGFTWLPSCLAKTNTSKIFFVGDSNIRRPVERLLRLLEESGMFKCNDLHDNTPRNDDGKLAIPKLPTEKDCSWIYRRVYMCGRTTGEDSGSSLAIHYVKMTYLTTSVNFNKLTNKQKNNRNCPHIVNKNTTTIQQYIFGDYLEQVKPDLIILGSSAHTRYLPLSKWRKQQRWLMTQVSSLVPQSIPVILFSQMSWCEQNLTPDKINRVEDNGTIYSINTQVRRQNMEFYHIFKQMLLTDHSNIFPFFDIYNLSSLVRPDWYIDWVHGRPEYYELLMRTFWGVFCNSFL